MSDSDSDNPYSDVLGSRRKTVQKKRPPPKAIQSDSDDDFPATSSKVVKKKRDPEASSSDSEEDIKKKMLELESHNEYLKKKVDKMVEDYTREAHKTPTRRIPKPRPTGCIDIANKMLNEMSETFKETQRKIDEVEVVKKNDDDDIPDLPVIISVLDCEQKPYVKLEHEMLQWNTFHDVREMYAKKWKCRVEDVCLTYKNQTVENSDTPSLLGIKPLQIPTPEFCVNKEFCEIPVASVENTSECITLKIQIKNGKAPIFVKAGMSTTLNQIKQKVIDKLEEEHESEIPKLEKMKIQFDDGFMPKNNGTCKALCLEDGDCLDITF